MRLSLLFAAALASSACTRAAVPAGPDAAPLPPPAPAPVAPAPDPAPEPEPEPEPEVELSHTTAEGKARFSTARIAAGRLSQSRKIEVHALKDRFGDWSTVATGSGRALTVVVPQGSGAGQGFVLVRPRQETTAQLPLGDLTPAALWLTPRRILIGAERSVFQLDLEARDARPTEVVTLDARLHPDKAWDLFVPRGDGVVAIDDVLFPVYAQVLAPQGDGGFKAAERWYVPAQLNGRYVDAALHEGTLVLLSHGGDAFGTFQRLTRTDEKSLVDPRVHADPRPESLVVVNLGEGQRRELRPLALPGRPPPPPAPPAAPQPPSLIAGSEYTQWSGLAVVGGQVATCAGARGLLSVPLAFESSTKGTLLDVGGRCLDVVQRGDTAVVLVSTGVLSSLVLVRADRTGALNRAAHYALLGTWSRLVR